MGWSLRAWLVPLLGSLALTLAPPTASATGATGTPTRLESAYSERAGEPLRQFGYDLFRAGTGAPGAVLGAVQDDHVLGIGDVLQVNLRGQLSRSGTHPVGTDGTILMEGFRPIQAAGRTLADVREEIAATVAAAHLQTESFVSLTSVRRVSVLVVGEVETPGRHELSAFATVLDALFAAGGIRPGGTLRTIRVVRPDGRTDTLDLYALLSDGVAPMASARVPDGARIVVPPLGATVAVGGQVKRPGIYELPPGAPGLALSELLALAGGPLRPGPQESIRLGFGRDGTETARPVEPGGAAELYADGDILIYAPARMDRTATVEFTGQVRRPGPLPLIPEAGLEAHLDPSGLTDEAYLPLATIARRDPSTGGTLYLPVDLAALTSGVRGPRPGPHLMGGDTVIVLGHADVAYLGSADVMGLLARGVHAPGTCPGLDALAAVLTADPGGGLAAGPLARAAAGLAGPAQPCPPLFAEHPDLLPYLLGRSVFLRRGVLRPGPYPAVDAIATESLVAAAGGRVQGPLEMVSGSPDGRVLDAAPSGVDLTGAVSAPGVRTVLEAPTLRRLLGDGRILANEAYGLFAVVERFDPTGVRAEFVPFAPLAVIAGRADLALQDRDRVHILDRRDLNPLDTDATTAPPALKDSNGAGSFDAGDREAAAINGRSRPSPEAAILALARDNMIRVRGAVMVEGTYPAAGEVGLPDIVAAAGGLSRDADQGLVEVTRSGDPAERLTVALTDPAVRIRAGDAVRIAPRARPGGSILVTGEVARPGRYDLLPGEKLASVLERAGGLTPQAYPDGAVFTRVSARRAEEEGLRRAATELDRGLALALLRQDPPDGTRVELVRQLADTLRTMPAVGRITVEADPIVLSVRPQENILLEDGDRIHIPKRPLTVTVSGEVLSPASLQFTSGKKLDAYLREAGGLTRYADSRRIFVLYPDGSSEPVRGRTGRHRLLSIPPGAIIVVPRDPEPFEFLPNAESLANVLGQLAIAAVALTVLVGQ